MQGNKKIAFVTGGSRGIGSAICRKLLEAGYEVIAPNREQLELSDIQGVRQYLLENENLEPSVVVINAGENNPKQISQINLEDWQHTLDVNLTSAFLLIQAFSKRMLDQGGGKIVAISSCYSVRSREGRSAYSVSKAGLNSFVQSAALEFAKGGVLINAVAPGFVLTDLTAQNNDEMGILRLTEQIPLGRLAMPEEIAEFVCFLTSEKNTYITGQLIPIDGGFLCR